MLALIEDHNPHAPGAILRDARPWPAYAVAMVVATVGEAVTPDMVAHTLGVQPSTAHGHLKSLTAAGFLTPDHDGWIPFWKGLRQ